MKPVATFLIIVFTIVNSEDLDEFIDQLIKNESLPKNCQHLKPETALPFLNLMESDGQLHLLVEHTDYSKEKSNMIEQVQDFNDKSGKVVHHEEEDNFMYIYFSYSNLTHITHLYKLVRQNCTNIVLDKLTNETQVFGPLQNWIKANLFQKKFLMSYIGEFNFTEKVHVWQACENNEAYLYFTSTKKNSRNLTSQNQKPLKFQKYYHKENLFSLELQDRFYKVVRLYEDEKKELYLPTGMNCYREPGSEDSLKDLNSSTILMNLNVIMVKNDSVLYSNNVKIFLDYFSKKSIMVHNYQENNPHSNFMLNIIDEQRDIKFSKNLKTGECNYSRLKNLNRSVDGPVIKLPNDIVLNFFNREWWALGYSFSYLGKRRIEGIFCKVYERRFHDFDLGPFGKHLVNVIRYYRHNAFEEDQLFRIDLDIYFNIFLKKDLTISLIISNLRTQLETEDIHFFDLSECFSDSNQHQWMQIVYKGFEIEPYWDFTFQELETKFRNVLQKKFGIDFLRMPQVEIQFHNDHFFITAKILEKPFIIDDFNTPKLSSKANYEKSLMTNNINECAQTCVDDVTCYGFTFCGNLMCLFNNDRIVNLTSDLNCNYIAKREQIDPRNEEKTIKGLLNSISLEIDISSAPLALYINSSFSNKLLKLEAQEIFTGFFPNRSITNFNSNVAHQTGFHKLIGSGRKYKSGHSSVIISLELDYDDCVEKCFEDVNCNSFSLCSTSKECTLSKFNLQTLDDVKSLTDYGECIIVAKDHLKEYKEWNGVAMIQNALAKSIVSKVNCAATCSNNPKCHSFDHCSDDNTCLLHSQNVLDLNHPDNLPQKWDSNKVNCSHYSKNYITEFYIHHNKKSLSKKLIKTTESSLEKCAKFCYQSTQCKLFGYCKDPESNKYFCYMSEETLKESGVVKTSKCSIYTRISNPFSLPTIISRIKIEVIMILAFLITVTGCFVALYVLRYVKAEQYV